QGVEGQAGRDFLVADDATAFADAVCSLLQQPERAQSLGAQARAFVEEHYNWNLVFKHLDTIIAKCAAAQR
ncbi:MAG: glycosyltransferase, partial [bacterium]